jgi:hypothetical protein
LEQNFLKLDSIILLHFFTFDTLLKKLYKSFAPLFLKVDKVEKNDINLIYYTNNIKENEISCNCRITVKV